MRVANLARKAWSSERKCCFLAWRRRVVREPWPMSGVIQKIDCATKKGTTFYDILICILQLITGIVVLSGSMGGRSWARYYLVFFTLYGIMHPVADLMYSKNFVSEGSKSIGAILAYIVYFAIWWAYFNRSKRVLNTYGPE